MLASTRSFTLDGISARAVRVEVDVNRGLPAFTIVGLPDAAVREARERVRAAIVNCGLEFPIQRIVASLAPASLRKAGPGLDLAIATALLAASGQLASDGLAGSALAGELALDGELRTIPGALAMAEAARAHGCERIFVPRENSREAALVDGITVVGAGSLAEVFAVLRGERDPEPPVPFDLHAHENGAGQPDLADLRGQTLLRQSLELAAAGGHSLLMIGPPGAGKSLAARRLPSIMPPLGREEAMEVARIASACGRFGPAAGSARPFRAPHHTISAAGLIGGGNPPRPGEATLAHRGILFLDELPEFSRDTLEAMRAPIETGTVSIARSGSWRQLPCSFMLVGAANPCPCGRGEADPRCECSHLDIRRYGARLSGALADRIDIVASVVQPTAADMGGSEGEPSSVVRERVVEARARQEARLGPGRANASMTVAEVRAEPLRPEATAILDASYESEHLSGRGYDRVLRLARTVADLDGEDRIGPRHVEVALGARSKHSR